MKKEHLEKIKDTWQPFYEEELTLEDANKIKMNLLKFEKCIKQFSQENTF